MLTARIFERARQRPDQLALIFDGIHLSYDQFARLIDGACRRLAPLELPTVKTAVLCINSLLDVWVAGLALRSLGATTMAVRTFDDIAGVAPDLGCLVMDSAEVSQSARETAKAAGWRLVELRAGDFNGGEVPPAAGSETAIAGGHIVLTSGTTGSYKKVLIDPASELANIPRRSALFGVSEHSLVNLFDFGGWTSAGYNMAVCAWGVGGAVAISQGDARFRRLPWASFTHSELHPEILRDLLAAGEPASPNPDMALIVISGSLSRALWEEARQRLTPKIFTCVSSTETGPFTVTAIETAEDLRWHRAHPSRRVEIVDEANQPVPPGVLGRLRIHIEDNIRGYLGDLETSAHFFRDGCFHPGDLAVFRPDGRFALQGRTTDVINVLGAKIATAPIEEALRDELGVKGVCLFSVQGADGGEELHIAIEGGADIDPQLLSAAIRARLHGFDQAHIHFVAALPRSPAGKIQRGAVRAAVMGGGG